MTVMSAVTMPAGALGLPQALFFCQDKFFLQRPSGFCLCGGIYQEVLVMANKQISAERTEEEKNIAVPVSEKFMLSIREASAYFSIGTKKMRRLAEDNIGEFAVCSGNRYLIIRAKFEKFIEESSAV